MNTQEALEYFDSLDPAPLDMMEGHWRGEGVITGHKMDGLLEAAHWHGKIFDGPDAVHPLVHRGSLGGTFFVNPVFLPLDLIATLPLRSRLIPLLVFILRPFMSTRKPKARLRMMEFRGKFSATMIYDAKPINDVFRKIDAATVLGLMDRKGDDAPFFFKLIKEKRR